eukprot:TRINITY_DN61682_c0_g1_i1.p1 TRINITY_DN61682_c0_g1~~TRINITY_DN61682_c0_g1_i1.p1  ORF type:complete len:575 (+),score=56.11 TRINITY_DN61682_c0_g1_i1:142-1725(+)
MADGLEIREANTFPNTGATIHEIRTAPRNVSSVGPPSDGASSSALSCASIARHGSSLTAMARGVTPAAIAGEESVLVDSTLGVGKDMLDVDGSLQAPASDDQAGNSMLEASPHVARSTSQLPARSAAWTQHSAGSPDSRRDTKDAIVVQSFGDECAAESDRTHCSIRANDGLEESTSSQVMRKPSSTSFSPPPRTCPSAPVRRHRTQRMPQLETHRNALCKRGPLSPEQNMVWPDLSHDVREIAGARTSTQPGSLYESASCMRGQALKRPASAGSPQTPQVMKRPAVEADRVLQKATQLPKFMCQASFVAHDSAMPADLVLAPSKARTRKNTQATGRRESKTTTQTPTKLQMAAQVQVGSASKKSRMDKVQLRGLALVEVPLFALVVPTDQMAPEGEGVAVLGAVSSSDLASQAGARGTSVNCGFLSSGHSSASGRPRRNSIRPLQTWRNERLVYERQPGSPTPSVRCAMLNAAMDQAQYAEFQALQAETTCVPSALEAACLVPSHALEDFPAADRTAGAASRKKKR